MGKNDTIIKRWLSDQRRFADIFNAVLFDGNPVFQSEKLHKVSSEYNIVLKGKTGNETFVQKFRDLVMETENETRLILLAIEHQVHIHYAMPVRMMLYDALDYTEQVQEKTKQYKKSRELHSSAEFLSGMKNDDTLRPCISIVFYYGKEEWDGQIDIHGLLGLNEPNLEVKKYIPNYQINLVDATELGGKNCLKSDLHWIFGMLKYKNDKEKLRNYVQSNEDFFEHVDEDSYRAAKVLLDMDMLIKTPEVERGEVNMCKALEDLYQGGVNEGVELGLSQGMAQERLTSIKNLMESMELTTEQAMTALKVPEDEWPEFSQKLKKS